MLPGDSSFRREPAEPIDTIVIPNKTFRKETGETIAQLQIARTVAKENVTERQKLMKERYDRNIYSRDFKPGDLVWVHFPEVMVGGSRKFFMNWSGPYIIVEKTSATNFKVAQAHNSKILKNEIHVNRMKPFYHRAVLPPKPELAANQEDIDDVYDLHPNDTLALEADKNAQTRSPSAELQPTVPEVKPVSVMKEPELLTIPEEASQILNLMRETKADTPKKAEESSQEDTLSLTPAPVKENKNQQGSQTAPERRASLLPPVAEET